MIKSKDRSGWIGASDTKFVMSNWNTPTFQKWWAVKLGIATNNFNTREMAAGTHYEHRILEAIGIRKMDRQIKVKKLRLRVNLDGETKDTIHEVKTHGNSDFQVSKAYWMQAQVEMFATGKKLVIDAYRLLPEEYDNYFKAIDFERLTQHSVEYSREWIESEYLPRLCVLADAMKKGVFPVESVRQDN